MATPSSSPNAMSAAANNAALEWMDLRQLATAIATAPVAELPRMLGQLRELEATALARMYTAPSTTEKGREPEQLLDITEAAKRLNVSEDYLYRHWKKLPFAHKYDWGVRFSARGIDEYIRNRGISVYTPRNKRSGGEQ